MSGSEATGLGRLGELFSDPVLVLEWPGGQIVDANQSARGIIDAAGAGTENFLECLAAPIETAQEFLAACAASGEALPGMLTVMNKGKAERYRANGCVLRPAGPDPTAWIAIRLSEPFATTQFSLLNEKIAELSNEITLRMRMETFLDDMRAAFGLITRGAPLDQVLEGIAHAVEHYSLTGMYASINLLDAEANTLRYAAAPSLPREYTDAIDNLVIGPEVGSCGSAAYLNRSVMVTDIATDPRWAPFKDLALAHGLRACWSTPIPSHDDQVLGTFALYYDEPKAPQPDEERLVAIASRTAAIAVERQRAQEKMQHLLELERRAREEAEGASLAKDEFLAVISHELRNPLSSILGWARLLQESDLDEESRARGLATIERNAENQSQLISDVLDFNRASTGSLRLAPEPVLLDKLIEKALDSLRPIARGQRISLEFAPPPAMVGPVFCDRERLYQVVYNLVSNALKFTPSEGRIEVELCRDGDHVAIRVRDSGDGIAQDFLPFVFDRFRQADSSSTRVHAGLGLGLAVVKSLVELHGGSVAAESRGLGEGSTFTVRLPSEAHAEGELADDRRKRERVDETDLRGIRVLVVDDEADALHLFTTILERAGADVSTAASGQEALRSIDEYRPDVLLSDIAMPGINGLDLLRSIRSRTDALAALPAAALSAHARERDRHGALASGYDLHLSKPIEPNQLVRAVHSLAQKAP